MSLSPTWWWYGVVGEFISYQSSHQSYLVILYCRYLTCNNSSCEVIYGTFRYCMSVNGKNKSVLNETECFPTDLPPHILIPQSVSDSGPEGQHRQHGSSPTRDVCE